MAVEILNLSLADGFNQSLMRIFAVVIDRFGNHHHKSISALPKTPNPWQRGLGTSLNSFLSWGMHQGHLESPHLEGFLYTLNL